MVWINTFGIIYRREEPTNLYKKQLSTLSDIRHEIPFHYNGLQKGFGLSPKPVESGEEYDVEITEAKRVDGMPKQVSQLFIRYFIAFSLSRPRFVPKIYY